MAGTDSGDHSAKCEGVALQLFAGRFSSRGAFSPLPRYRWNCEWFGSTKWKWSADRRFTTGAANDPVSGLKWYPLVAMKAAWGCRTPKPRGSSSAQSVAPAVWSAAAPCRLLRPVELYKSVLRHVIEDEFGHFKHADAFLAVENLA